MLQTSQPKIILVIPVYNCEKQLPRVLAGLTEEVVKKLNKIILIDNQSQDKSFQVGQSLFQNKNSEKFQIFQNPMNVGLGGTHKVAFQLAKKNGADYLAILHGDDQARGQELGSLIEHAEMHPETDAILGARFMRKSKLSGYSHLRIFGNVILNIAYTLLTGRLTKDLGSGLNLFKTLENEKYLNFSNGFTFNMDLLLYYYQMRKKVHFVPISWVETDQVSNAKTFSVGWLSLMTLLKWRFNRKFNG